MNIKNDEMLQHLRSFGFRLEERTNEGFLRYGKRIGDLLVTICNRQFENKIRVSMLQNKDGHIRTSYKDILAYTEMIGAMQEAGLIVNANTITFMNEQEETGDEYDMSENPLISFPRKPAGFMAQ